MRLAGRCAIVTGAAGGIGRAIAERYAAEGALVAIADRNAAAAEAVARAIGPSAHAIPFNCTNAAEIDALVAGTTARWGSIDILVTAAGLFSAAPIEELTREDWTRLMAVNVEGTLFTLQAVARSMIARGRGGRIITIASMAGRRGAPLTPAYNATKAAVISLTQSAAQRLIPHGINVNAIAPGEVDTAMWDEADLAFARLTGAPVGETKRAATAAVPAGRMAAPADIAAMAAFLASDEASYIVGQVFGVDGGIWMA